MWKGRTHRHGPSRSVRKGGVLQTHCAEGARIHTGSFLQNSVHSAVVLDTAVSQQRGVLDAPVRSVPEAGIRHADCMRWASLSDPFQCSAVGHCLPVLETLDVASLELCSTRTTLPRADRARPTRLHTVLSWGPLSIAAHMVAAMVNILGTAFGDSVTHPGHNNIAIKHTRSRMPTTSVRRRRFRFGRLAGRCKRHQLDHLAEQRLSTTGKATPRMCTRTRHR